MRRLPAALLALTVTAQAETLSFVTCPVVRDTATAPCWLAEYQGELYFLGVQSGVAQDFYPPQLNHEVLVEGTVAEGPRVCGGIPMQTVKISVMIEINRSCNTILPAEDGIEAPPRGIGPGRGTGSPPVSSWTRSDGPDDVTIFFDFDSDFLSLHSTGAVQRIVEHFRQTSARDLQVTVHRGASKLSNGAILVEAPAITRERAVKIQAILVGLGVPVDALKMQLMNEPAAPDGINDPWSRKVTLAVKR
jgi:hypothetical protein